MCLLDQIGAKCYQSFAKQLFQSSGTRPSCSPCAENNLPAVTRITSPNSSMKFNHRSLPGFPLSLSLLAPALLPMTTTGPRIDFPSPLPSLFPVIDPFPRYVVRSFTRSRDSLGRNPINYPPTEHYILNVTFLTFSHASCLPPTISPLFRCKCFSGGAA